MHSRACYEGCSTFQQRRVFGVKRVQSQRGGCSPRGEGAALNAAVRCAQQGIIKCEDQHRSCRTYTGPTSEPRPSVSATDGSADERGGGATAAARVRDGCGGTRTSQGWLGVRSGGGLAAPGRMYVLRGVPSVRASSFSGVPPLTQPTSRVLVFSGRLQLDSLSMRHTSMRCVLGVDVVYRRRHGI
jgi:hypothetical protein